MLSENISFDSNFRFRRREKITGNICRSISDVEMNYLEQTAEAGAKWIWSPSGHASRNTI